MADDDGAARAKLESLLAETLMLIPARNWSADPVPRTNPGPSKRDTLEHVLRMLAERPSESTAAALLDLACDPDSDVQVIAASAALCVARGDDIGDAVERALAAWAGLRDARRRERESS